MCKSIEDSIFSGSLSYFTGMALISTRKPSYIWIGVFIIAVGTMQWVDATIWYRKAHGLSVENIGRIAIPVVLALEAISAYLGYVYFYGKRMILYEIILIGVIVYLVQNYYFKCKDIPIGNDGYLTWCGKSVQDSNIYTRTFFRLLFILILFFPFFFHPDIILKYILFAISFILWAYTIQFDSFGSRWCYSFFVLDIFILVKLFIFG